MNKHKEEIAICLICVLTGFLGGAITDMQIMTRKFLRESLEGYRAIALYETNSVGEVKIKKIEWKKP